MFSSDLPKLPRPLPRHLTPDLDRRLTAALQGHPDRLAADALLLQRAVGLRMGELVDLELDCIHEIPGQGAGLKVPLGKLDTERMVTLDEEAVILVDRVAAHRSPDRPLAQGLVNAGVSLRSPMALLGHASATMSLRYRRRVGATVKAEYERALTAA